MPSILFVGHAADRTGPPVFLLGLQRWLREHTDVQVTTVLQRGGDLEAAYRALGPVHLLDGDHHHLEPVVDAAEHDLVYLNASWTVRSLGALADPRAVVAHVHEMEDVLRFHLDDVDRRTLFDRPDGFLVGCRAAHRNLVERHGVDPTRITTVPYWAEPVAVELDVPTARSATRAQLGVPDDLPLLVGAGVVDWRKAPDLLLHLVWELDRRGVRAGALWIGSRNERPTWCDWDEEAAALGLADRTFRLESTPDFAAALAAGDVLVLPSREDTFPLVCVDAAALGLPLACWDDIGIVELVEDDGAGAAGVVAPYPDLGVLAERLVPLVADPGRRAEAGRVAAARVQARHRIDVAAPQLLAALAPWLGG